MRLTSNQTRRRISFSLRTLLVAVTAIAVFLGWYVRSDIVVSAMPEKPEYMLGEPGTVLFKVTDRSGKYQAITVGGDYRNRLGRPESFQVEVVGEDGKNVPQPDAGMQMGGLSAPQKLPTNEPYVFGLFLPHWATFEKPGRYTIKIRRKLELFLADGPLALNGKTESIEASATTTVLIVPKDAVKFGKLISKLGNTMLGDNYNEAERAEMILTAMHDERVISYFVPLADRARLEPRYAACRALGKYDNDQALATLKKLTTTTGADLRDHATPSEHAESSAAAVRHLAIITISKSPHPDANPLLWSFADDADHRVRMTVLKKAAKLNTPETRAIIKKMTTDENERVRNEALRYQKQLAHPQR